MGAFFVGFKLAEITEGDVTEDGKAIVLCQKGQRAAVEITGIIDLWLRLEKS